MGCLIFVNPSNGHIFDLELKDFAARLAASACLALRNSALYSAEREIAETLQSAMLSMPSQIEGVEYAHFYRSATKTARVGGDFYDLFEIDQDHLGVIIGDVSGKGLGAAALTVLIKNTVKAYAHEKNSPARMITKTNEIAKRASSGASFVTLFVGILDRRTGTVIFCNAGHPPPILSRASGKAESLKTGHPAIGAFSGLEYSNEKVDMNIKDTILLFTDGVIEARRAKELFGESRLHRLLSVHRGVSMKDLVTNVVDQVMDYSEGDLLDDLAVLAITRR